MNNSVNFGRDNPRIIRFKIHSLFQDNPRVIPKYFKRTLLFQKQIINKLW